MFMPDPKVPFLDQRHEYVHSALDRPITDKRAWTRNSLDPDATIVHLDDDQRAELMRLADQLTHDPAHDMMPFPAGIEAPLLQAAANEIRTYLQNPGFGTVDRLPMDEIGVDTGRMLYWILSNMVARPVAQKWDGAMAMDVIDQGKKGYGERSQDGYGLRGSQTSAELLFHTDNGFNALMPDAVSLLCINKAKEGGLSRFASVYSLHNLMLQRYPKHLKRLYRPVLFDRVLEHAEDEPMVLRAPVFQWNGESLKARTNAVYIRQGYDLGEVEMDAELIDALEALIEVTNDPDLSVEMLMERGQMQYLNNSVVLHYRSSYVDYDEPERKRHCVRMWFREEGEPTYNG